MIVERSTITAARRAFGRQLAELRAASNLTQLDLARLTGYSRSTVVNIEAGYQLASPDFCRKCDDVLSTGGVRLLMSDGECTTGLTWGEGS
ncbi:MAG: helix-turn-helix transcriptional regulator [Pseudonocardiaceae bacterium]